MKSINPLLGGDSLIEFMRTHWQRAPLLVRSAFPDFTPPLSRDDLFELAQDPDVESRLVSQTAGRWRLQRGPFEPGKVPPRARRNWTLLVQGTDLHDDSVHALLARFRFIADARLDDLMISYAVDGGGVGPHLDSYDVFLIQTHGRRRWRIAPPGDTTLVPEAPLKLLANFVPTQEWVLEPGDMLYLPPGWGHDGVALGECMTCSVGFRAPSRHELLAAWLADCADAVPEGPDPRYGDAGTPPTVNPGCIPEPMHRTLSDWLLGWRASASQVEDFIGRFLTEPKPNVWFEAPEKPMSATAFAAACRRRGLRTDRRTRIVYRDARCYINGESVTIDPDGQRLLVQLADTHTLEPSALTGAGSDALLAGVLHAWYEAGWIHPC